MFCQWGWYISGLVGGKCSVSGGGLLVVWWGVSVLSVGRFVCGLVGS